MDGSKPFCIYYKDGVLTCVEGHIEALEKLSAIPRKQAMHGLASVSMVPYCQIKERGFQVRDENEKILSLVPETVRTLPVAEFVEGKDCPITLESDLTYNLSDAEFIEIVRSVIEDEIKNGEGSNFLISRKCLGKIKNFHAGIPLSILSRFIENEFGAYCDFCFFDGERYFIGASPERHLSYYGNTIMMNPICGTLPKSQLNSRQDLIDFLSDPKEIHELFQVVDEELKMMAKICYVGGEMEGPYIKEMRTLVHTEYLLRGQSEMDPVKAFELSMFAPTMIGSPLENAARIIYKHEKDARRYYSSAILFLGQDADDKDFLDSAITIRTMEIDLEGNFVIQSGASIVRDSVPEKECLEVKTKARGLIDAILGKQRVTSLASQFIDPLVIKTLSARNGNLSGFWKDKQSVASADPRLKEIRMVIVDNEDEFTFMLRHMLEHIGISTRVLRIADEAIELAPDDILLVGPGPGDPTNMDDPRIRKVHALTRKALAENRKFVAVCLGHQVLSAVLGLDIIKVDPPLQGFQEKIDLFGSPEIVGFYNTFFSLYDPSRLSAMVTASVDDEQRIYAMKSDTFVSFQFHLESILTPNGVDILRNALYELLDR